MSGTERPTNGPDERMRRPESQRSAPDRGQRIVIPIFNGITALDAIGPYEVLSRMRGAKVTFAGFERGQVVTDSGMLRLVAEATFEEVEQVDVLLVPGGLGTRALMSNERLLSWLGKAASQASWTTSVCTGSLLLASAGLLEGREATTHWLEMETLSRLGAKPVSRRIVDGGAGTMTAAGVSSGIDLALTLAAKIEGEDVAKAIQLTIEYDPQPPFDAGSPRSAPKSVVERVKAAARRRA